MPRFLVLLVGCLGTLYAQEVRYELRFPNAAHHEAEVRATFAGVPAGPLEVVMSRSSPGRYSLHDFARNVYKVRASDAAGRALAVEHATPYQWNVSGHAGTVVFEYTLFGDFVDGTYDAIDLTHAHLNGPATFVWARGMEARRARVKLEAPAGSGWTIATQLPEVDGWYTASSRDVLMDSPIEFGMHKVRDWRVGDHQFRMVLHSPVDDETATKYAKLAEAIAVEAEGVWGAFPKYDYGRYTMLVDYLPWANGDGMEHRNSTVVTRAFPAGGSAQGPIDTLSHEFFHGWNVERIRPQGLEPFDFERANITGELWFAEGVTNYYGPLVQLRAGVMDLDRFAVNLGGALNTVLNSPAREFLDVTQVSARAPFIDRAASNDVENRTNVFLSYYSFGQVLGAGIDFEIRSRFPGKSLDDWMRAMWRRHPDVDKAYSRTDLEAALAEVTSAAFAREMFGRYVTGREAMPYAELLARAGLVLRKSGPGTVWLGTTATSVGKDGALVTAPVRRGSPAYVAGIDRGDRIVSVDGKGIEENKDWDSILKSHKPGENSRVVVEGRGGQRTVSLAWQESPNVELITFEKAGREVTAEVRAFREGWMRSRAIHPVGKEASR